MMRKGAGDLATRLVVLVAGIVVVASCAAGEVINGDGGTWNLTGASGSSGVSGSSTSSGSSSGGSTSGAPGDDAGYGPPSTSGSSGGGDDAVAPSSGGDDSGFERWLRWRNERRRGRRHRVLGGKLLGLLRLDQHVPGRERYGRLRLGRRVVHHLRVGAGLQRRRLRGPRQLQLQLLGRIIIVVGVRVGRWVVQRWQRELVSKMHALQRVLHVRRRLRVPYILHPRHLQRLNREPGR